MDAKCSDLIYHMCEVVELRKSSSVFYYLKEEITKFLENEPVKLEELENEFWNHDVFLFCNITAQLNDLNIQLQQNDKLIFKMFAAVKTSR